MDSSKEKVEKLISLCEEYNKHLARETQSSKDNNQHFSKIAQLTEALQKKNSIPFTKKEIAEIKQAIVLQMLGLLKSPTVPDNIKIVYLKSLLQTKNNGLTYADVLSMKRSSKSSKIEQILEKILHKILHIITPRLSFWQPHGKKTVDAMETIINTNPKNKST